MTESELAALVAGICADPDDDTPRMVYADWLDENGEPERAEFIRVQCGLARTDPNTATSPDHERNRDPRCPCDYCVLRRRERELWCNGSWAWFRFHNLRPVDTQQPCHLHWVDSSERDVFRTTVRRGFIEMVYCTAADWLRHADALAWSPGMTDEFPEPRDPKLGVYSNADHGGLGYSSVRAHKGCPRCDGTGRVPRPCPPTAQPIRRVVLTALPTAHVPEFNALRDWVRPLEYGLDVRDVFEAEWDWIKFAFPDPDGHDS